MRRSFVRNGPLAAALLAALALASARCNYMEIQDWPCPQGGTKLTWDNFGKGFMQRNCQWCHGGTERRGAPSEYDFGSVEAVRKLAPRVFARSAGPNATMPPGPDDPPASERDQLAEWLACGAP